MFKKFFAVVAILLAGQFVFSQLAVSQENGYYPYVIARGVDREILRNTPIENRPTRPLHILGNAVRSDYYFGSGLIAERIQSPLMTQPPNPRLPRVLIRRR